VIHLQAKTRTLLQFGMVWEASATIKVSVSRT
jgi:hypothetical protein